MNREKAEAHWKFIEKVLLLMVDVMHFLYVEAMVHGAKHEREDK
jgi:hypothetical protein